jgi:hypothetical protein
VNPAEWAEFRTKLVRRYGFVPDLNGYIGAVVRGHVTIGRESGTGNLFVTSDTPLTYATLAPEDILAALDGRDVALKFSADEFMALDMLCRARGGAVAKADDSL